MKSYSAPTISPEIAERIRAKVQAGLGREDVIWAMRREGLQIVDCMKLVHLFYGISRNEAKELVHFSDAWASMRLAHDAVHDAAECVAQEGQSEAGEHAPLRSAS